MVTLPVHAAGGASRWLLIHLLLLGAATNAIVVWSVHFTTSLLGAPEPSRRAAAVRLVALNAGVLAVLAGVTAGSTPVVFAGAAAIVGVLIAHLAVLVTSAVHRTRPRFLPTAWFYWSAAVALCCGVAAGAAMVAGLPPGWFARVYVAHVVLNVFGWLALAILGTQLTLWPMIQRDRIAEGVERAARWALAGCAGGLVLMVAGALADLVPMTAAGSALYAIGVVTGTGPWVWPTRRRVPRSPSAWMLAAGSGWLVVSVVTVLVATVRSRGPGSVASAVGTVVPWLAAGFVAQVLTGALTYLLATVLSGGPSSGRRVASFLDRWGGLRVSALNVGVALVALRLPAPVTDVGWVLIGACYAAFVVLAGGVVVSRVARNPGPASDQRS